MRIIFAILVLVAAQAACREWGFSLSSGPGYRQDRLTWQGSSIQEVYPHLRMFDWKLSFDASLRQFHLMGEGDMGWFSSQTMRLSSSNYFPAPVSFSYVVNGRAATGTLALGYQFGNAAKGILMPLTGWLYDSANLRCNRPIPPFARIAPSLDASIAFTSNQHLAWQGPMVGGQLAWQPISALRFVGLYAYGWVHATHSFTQLNTLRTGATFQQNTFHEIGSSSGHSQLALFQLLCFLSRRISLDSSFRYLSLQSSSSKLSSFTLSAALDYRF